MSAKDQRSITSFYKSLNQESTEKINNEKNLSNCPQLSKLSSSFSKTPTPPGTSKNHRRKSNVDSESDYFSEEDSSAVLDPSVEADNKNEGNYCM